MIDYFVASGIRVLSNLYINIALNLRFNWRRQFREKFSLCLLRQQKQNDQYFKLELNTLVFAS